MVSPSSASLHFYFARRIPRIKTIRHLITEPTTPPMEINLLLTLDLREQAALQAALVTHGAPDSLVTLALTGACRISSLYEARKLHNWLVHARTAGETDFASLRAIARALEQFGI